MNNQTLLFVGGSREGLPLAGVSDPVITFVNGIFIRPGEDGSIDPPLNATVETYLLEQVDADGGDESFAYFLAGMDRSQYAERLDIVRKRLQSAANH